jgi:tetratricopeptide (TPR) repeat protein
MIRLNAKEPGVWNSLCWSRALAGELQLALGNCNESLRMRPDDAETLDSRAVAYFKLGRFAEAFADFDAALKRNEKMASALYGRGVSRLKQGDVEKGEADIAAAKALKADIAEEYSGYGVK